MIGADVIIPVWNGELYIGEALDSIAAQTRLPDQVIIIDDGSSDETAIVAQSHPLKPLYIRQDHAGAAAARNRGLAAAEAGLVAFLDADDVWLPEKLERQLAAFKDDPHLAMVFTHIEQFVSPDVQDVGFRFDAGAVPGECPSTLVVRRDAIARVGSFDTTLSAGEFVDWCARAREAGLKEQMLPELLCRRRLHARNSGRTVSRQDYVRVARLALERRRGRTEPL